MGNVAVHFYDVDFYFYCRYIDIDKNEQQVMKIKIIQQTRKHILLLKYCSITKNFNIWKFIQTFMEYIIRNIYVL